MVPALIGPGRGAGPGSGARLMGRRLVLGCLSPGARVRAGCRRGRARDSHLKCGEIWKNDAIVQFLASESWSVHPLDRDQFIHQIY